MNAVGGASWERAERVAALLSMLPGQLGGVRVQGAFGPAWDAWLDRLTCWGERANWRRMNSATALDHLLGGVDVFASLVAGKRQIRAGILDQPGAKVLFSRGSERLEAPQVAAICHAMDDATAPLDLIAATAQWDIAPPLSERLSLCVDLDAAGRECLQPSMLTRADIEAARDRYDELTLSPDQLQRLCEAAPQLGVRSMRGMLTGTRVVRGLAALDRASAVSDQHLVDALALMADPQLVVATPPESAPAPPAEEDGASEPQEAAGPESASADGAGGDFDATQALLSAVQQVAGLGLGRARRKRSMPRMRGRGGKTGAEVYSLSRGRHVGAVQARPGGDRSLDLMATIRAAIPQQPFRSAAERAQTALQFRPADFRVRRYKRRAATATLFLVDASGSAALERLGEAKGAVEQLLVDCYVRRDEVALIAFRGTGAETLLPLTRSLVRAKRALVGLAGGGGTPLAAGLLGAYGMASQVMQKGFDPYVVVLTDARANVTLAGEGGRELAFEQALTAADRIREQGWLSMVLDASPRGSAQARTLAERLGGSCLPLPFGGADRIRSAILNDRRQAS